MAINSNFTAAYLKLLILQYSEQDKASGDITAKLDHFSKIYDVIDRWHDEFDLDNATGDRLDIIGSVVQMPRTINGVVPKEYFGFDDNTLSTGFDDKFADLNIPLNPFKDKFENPYTTAQLSDADYRDFIRLKIGKNTASATISNSFNRIGLMNAAMLFDAIVVDNYDMSITYYFDYSTSETKLNIAQSLGLLPAPQAVGRGAIRYFDSSGTFGFSDNVNSVGFGQGTFASKVI